MFESVTPHHLPLHRQRFQDVRRVPVDCCQERLGRSGGFAPALLPVAQRPHVHMEQGSELWLAQAELGVQLLDGERFDVEFPGGRSPAPGDLIHLRHALDKLGKQLLVHGLPLTNQR